MKPKAKKSDRAPLKGREVWAVITADPLSDDPGYLAYTSLFASKEEARKCLRNSAKEDKGIVGGKIKWYERNTDQEWCEVYHPCYPTPRWTHSLECLTIN